MKSVMKKIAHFNNLKVVKGDLNWQSPPVQDENEPDSEDPDSVRDGGRYNLRQRSRR